MGLADDGLFFGYSRVSTDEQADSRNGLEAQRSAIDVEAARRGWTVEHHADEGASGKYINSNLQVALQLLASGQGDGLIVAKLDRLARSIVHAANIIDAAQAQGWSLVVLDRNAGLSFGRIARALEAEAILSPAGRPTWQVSTVRRIYQSATATSELETAS